MSERKARVLLVEDDDSIRSAVDVSLRPDFDTVIAKVQVGRGAAPLFVPTFP